MPSYPLPHEKRFACYVLNTLLGGGMSSRLFQNIRERQGLAYAVFSELSPYRDTGCLTIYAGTSLGSARKVVESILKEFRDLKQQPVGTEELRRAKDHLKGSLMLGLESTSSRMSNLARQEMYFGHFFSLDDLVESIEAVTADEVQSIAQTFFDPKQIAVTVLGNLEKVQADPRRPGLLVGHASACPPGGCPAVSRTCRTPRRAAFAWTNFRDKLKHVLQSGAPHR